MKIWKRKTVLKSKLKIIQKIHDLKHNNKKNFKWKIRKKWKQHIMKWKFEKEKTMLKSE